MMCMICNAVTVLLEDMYSKSLSAVRVDRETHEMV